MCTLGQHFVVMKTGQNVAPCKPKKQWSLEICSHNYSGQGIGKNKTKAREQLLFF